MKELEKQMKALANGRRLSILKFLKANKEETVGGIAEAIKLSLKSTSRHLGVLYSAGIVEKDQRNVEVYYCIAPRTHPATKFVIALLN